MHLHQDSTGKPVRIGSKVKHRGKTRTIKRFIPPPAEEAGPPNYRMDFEEETMFPMAKETEIDCYEY